MSEEASHEGGSPSTESSITVVLPIEIRNPDIITQRLKEGYQGPLIEHEVTDGRIMLPDQVPIQLSVLPRNSRHSHEKTVDLSAEVLCGNGITATGNYDRREVLFAAVGAMHHGEAPLFPNNRNRYVVQGSNGEELQVGLNEKPDRRGDFGIMIKSGHQGHSPTEASAIQTIATIVSGMDAARNAATRMGDRFDRTRYVVSIPGLPNTPKLSG